MDKLSPVSRPRRKERKGLMALLIRQWITSKNPFLYRLSADEMFLHKARNLLRRHAVIPRSFRIHQHGRPLAADTQAAHLGAVTGVWPGSKTGFFELFFQFFPACLSGFRCAATR